LGGGSSGGAAQQSKVAAKVAVLDAVRALHTDFEAGIYDKEEYVKLKADLLS